MIDEEFVEKLPYKIYGYYKKAKSHCVDCPDHSLVCIRSLCDEIIRELLRSKGKKFNDGDLILKIKNAYNLNIITNEQYKSFNNLRENGNKGAHPNRFLLSHDDKILFAKESISKVFYLLKDFYFDITGNKCPDNIDFIENYYSKEYCYEALFGSDFESKCKVGLVSKDKYYQTKDKKYYDQALYFFSLGIGVHPESTYQYGIIYNPIDENDVKNEINIELAANLGQIEAKAFLAQFYRDGSKLFNVDYEKSRLLFEEAAKCGDIKALSDLAGC